MNNIDNQKRFYINKLYEIYGLLLTEKQQQMFEDYYQYDLSLQEIATNYNVSRSAVLDALQKSVSKLEEYESKLHFLDKKHEIDEVLKKHGIESIVATTQTTVNRDDIYIS